MTDEFDHAEWKEAECDERKRQLEAEMSVIEERIERLREEQFEIVLATECYDSLARAVIRIAPSDEREELKQRLLDTQPGRGGGDR